MNTSESTDLETHLQQLAQLIEAGNCQEAARKAGDSTFNFPYSGELLRLQAVALHQLGRSDEAMALLLQAEALEPDNVRIPCNLASIEVADGKADQGIERMRATLRRMPGHPMVLLVLGNALMAAARYQHARDSYSMATHGAPDHPGIRLNLAAAELKLDHPELCEVHATEAMQIAPKMAAAYVLLGHSQRVRGQHAKALQSFLRAEKLEPAVVEHPYHAAQMLDQLGRLPDAASAYARALQIDGWHGAALGQRIFTLRRLCQWDELETLGSTLRTALARGATGIGPFGMLAETATALEQRRCAEIFAAETDQKMAPLRRQLQFQHSKRLPDEPLRIGMVSDGFGEHPTGLLIVAMLEALALDPGNIEMHLYATRPSDQGAIRKRLESACRVHATEHLGNASLARRIHSDGIEILIDLTVYCEGSNAELLALRPAPVQVNWLGYPGTSGAPWMDYLVADHTTMPDIARIEVSEKLLRLPGCFQPSDTSRVVPPAPAREMCGLPAQEVVFGCFNASFKINPESFDRFMQILRQTPGSILWLLNDETDARENLRRQAALRGIDPDRLVFMSKLPHAAYLSRYQLVDLFLDTLPYNAHTTASDALWAGCPVLTLAGVTFAGRVAASLLHHLGLDELITSSGEAFVDTAVRLANNPTELQELRRRICGARRDSTLFDMKGFAADFRRAMLAMMARHRIGRPPADIDI